MLWHDCKLLKIKIMYYYKEIEWKNVATIEKIPKINFQAKDAKTSISTSWLVLTSIGIVINISKRFQNGKSTLKLIIISFTIKYCFSSNYICLTSSRNPLLVWMISTKVASSLLILLDSSDKSNQGLAGSSPG